MWQYEWQNCWCFFYCIYIHITCTYFRLERYHLLIMFPSKDCIIFSQWSLITSSFLSLIHHARLNRALLIFECKLVTTHHLSHFISTTKPRGFDFPSFSPNYLTHRSLPLAISIFDAFRKFWLHDNRLLFDIRDAVNRTNLPFLINSWMDIILVDRQWESYKINFLSWPW